MLKVMRFGRRLIDSVFMTGKWILRLLPPKEADRAGFYCFLYGKTFTANILKLAQPVQPTPGGPYSVFIPDS